MAPAILLVRYPRGELPGHGFRCPRCGEEFMTMEEADGLRKDAHRIGLSAWSRSAAASCSAPATTSP